MASWFITRFFIGGVANTLVKHACKWINPFSKVLSLFQGFCASSFFWAPFSRGGRMPFSRLFLLSPWLQTRQVHHELSYCICKLPVAPPTNLVGLEAPGVGLIDDLWVVIHDAQGSKVACPVHFGVMPSEGIGAPVGLHLFQGGAQQLWDLVHGFFKPVLRPHPADDVDIHNSQHLLQSLQAGWHPVPFFKGIVPVQHHTLDIQSLPEGLLLCHLLSGSEASPAHRPAPGPILPDRVCSTFFKVSSSSCSFSRASAFCASAEANAFFKASSFSCREAEEVAGGSVMAREVHWRISLACLLAWEVVPLMACLPLLFTFSSEPLSFLGGITFSSGPPQVGWFFQTWRGLAFQTWKEFFQTLCVHSYNYKRLSAVGCSAVTMLWLEYVVAITYISGLPYMHVLCSCVGVCVCARIYCPTIHVLCCCVSVHACVCVQWHGHAWAKLAAGHIQVTNQQKHRQNLQLSGVTHLGVKPHSPLVGPFFQQTSYIQNYVHT